MENQLVVLPNEVDEIAKNVSVAVADNEKVLKKAGFRSTILPPTTNDNKMQTLQLTDTPPLSLIRCYAQLLPVNFHTKHGNCL